MANIKRPVQPGTGSALPEYGRLVECCKHYGIKRTQAFALARSGLLQTFTIGKCRYVLLESLRTLPERLAAPAVQLDGTREGGGA